VELVAAMVILALLVFLLQPVYRQVQLKGAATVCLSQLKQLALAHRLYENDHSGKPPPNFVNSSHPYSEGHQTPGIRLLRRYYRSPVNGNYIWNGNDFMRESLEICPSSRTNQLSSNLKNGPDYELSSIDVHYAVYYDEPAQRPLLWDGFTGYWASSKPKVPLRHAGGIHCVFLDGHAENIKMDDSRLFHRWWHYAINDRKPDSKWLGDGNAMGSNQVPE